MQLFLALAAVMAITVNTTPASAQSCPSPGAGGVYTTEPPSGCLKPGQTVRVMRTAADVQSKKHGCGSATYTVTGGQGSDMSNAARINRVRRCN